MFYVIQILQETDLILIFFCKKVLDWLIFDVFFIYSYMIGIMQKITYIFQILEIMSTFMALMHQNSNITQLINFTDVSRDVSIISA